MGFFDIFRKPKQHIRSYSGTLRQEGGRVVYYPSSPTFAEKVAAVYSCEKLISESIAKIPLEVKRYNSAGRYYVRDVKNPLYDILATRPNARMTAYDLLRGTVMNMLNYGNAYLYPERDGKGDVVALYLLEGVNFDRYANAYTVNDNTNGIYGVYTADRIIHLRNLGSDAYLGESTIRIAARTIGISTDADNELSQLFTSGNRHRGIITGSADSPMGYGANKVNAMEKAKEDMQNDLRSGDTIVVLPGDMKFTPFTMTPADVQLLDNKKFTVKEIGRFFRVPPSMLYEDGGSTYSNAEMDSVLFLNGALSPLLRQIELELSSKLIADEERGYYKIQFDREALYTTDLTTKANYMKATIESGVRTVNEWRKAEGFPALVGGDEAVVSANLVTLKSRINEGQQEGNTQP
jgi:HK97 family phage portal protein